MTDFTKDNFVILWEEIPKEFCNNIPPKHKKFNDDFYKIIKDDKKWDELYEKNYNIYIIKLKLNKALKEILGYIPFPYIGINDGTLSKEQLKILKDSEKIAYEKEKSFKKMKRDFCENNLEELQANLNLFHQFKENGKIT